MTADGEVAKQISALEDRRYQAMTDGDTDTLAGLFSPDLLYSHSDASTDTKQSYLDKLSSGFFDYGPMEHPEHAVLVHGDSAVVLHDMRGEVLVDGATRVLNSRALAVWVKDGERWLLLAFQPTKYPA